MFQSLIVGLEASLRDPEKKYQDKVCALLAAWERLASLTSSAPEVIGKLTDLLHRDTLSLVLQGDWPKLQKAVKTHLGVTLQRCASTLLDHTAASKIRSLIGLINDPWGHPTLSRILEGAEIEDSEVLDFCHSEKGILLSMRLEMLCDSKCEDFALKLARICVRCLRISGSRLQEDSSKEQVYYFMDLYIILLYKFKKIQEILKQLKYLELREGLDLIRRYSMKLDSQLCVGSAARVWKNSLKVAEVAAQYFLAAAMVRPVSESGLLRDLMTEWAIVHCKIQVMPEALADMVRKLIQPAQSAVHIYIFCDVLLKEFGNAVKPLCIELYIRGLTANMNELEELKVKNDKDKVKDAETRLSDGFLRLADLLKDNIGVCRECILTAFSLNPTRYCYDRIKEMAVISGKIISVKTGAGSAETFVEKPANFEELRRIVSEESDKVTPGVCVHGEIYNCCRRCKDGSGESYSEFFKTGTGSMNLDTGQGKQGCSGSETWNIAKDHQLPFGSVCFAEQKGRSDAHSLVNDVDGKATVSSSQSSSVEGLPKREANGGFSRDVRNSGKGGNSYSGIPTVIKSFENCRHKSDSKCGATDSFESFYKMTDGLINQLGSVSSHAQRSHISGTNSDRSPVVEKKERTLDALVLLKGKAVTESLNYDVLSAPNQVLDAEKLGLTRQLCDDLAVVLSSPRWQMLSWVLDWSELSSMCERCLEKGEGMRNVTQELKYLNIDYSQFKDWPSDEEEKDEYYGIEKGYERWADSSDPSDEEYSFSHSYKRSRSRRSQDETDSDSSLNRRRKGKVKKASHRLDSSGSEYDSRETRESRMRRKNFRGASLSISDSDTNTQDSRTDSVSSDNIRLEKSNKRTKSHRSENVSAGKRVTQKKLKDISHIRVVMNEDEMSDLSTEVMNIFAHIEDGSKQVTTSQFSHCTTTCPYVSSNHCIERRSSDPKVVKTLRMFRPHNLKKPSRDEISQGIESNYMAHARLNANMKEQQNPGYPGFAPMLSTLNLNPHIVLTRAETANNGATRTSTSPSKEAKTRVVYAHGEHKPHILRKSEHTLSTKNGSFIENKNQFTLSQSIDKDSLDARQGLNMLAQAIESHLLERTVPGLNSLDMMVPPPAEPMIQIVQLPRTPASTSGGNAGSSNSPPKVSSQSMQTSGLRSDLHSVNNPSTTNPHENWQSQNPQTSFSSSEGSSQQPATHETSTYVSTGTQSGESSVSTSRDSTSQTLSSTTSGVSTSTPVSAHIQKIGQPVMGHDSSAFRSSTVHLVHRCAPHIQGGTPLPVVKGVNLNLVTGGRRLVTSTNSNSSADISVTSNMSDPQAAGFSDTQKLLLCKKDGKTYLTSVSFPQTSATETVAKLKQIRKPKTEGDSQPTVVTSTIRLTPRTDQPPVITARSVYEETYAKFVLGANVKGKQIPPSAKVQKQTATQVASLPKFQQAFGKTMYQSNTSTLDDGNNSSSSQQLSTSTSEQSERIAGANVISSKNISQTVEATPVCTVMSKGVQTSSMESTQNVHTSTIKTLAPCTVQSSGDNIMPQTVQITSVGNILQSTSSSDNTNQQIQRLSETTSRSSGTNIHPVKAAASVKFARQIPGISSSVSSPAASLSSSVSSSITPQRTVLTLAPQVSLVSDSQKQCSTKSSSARQNCINVPTSSHSVAKEVPLRASILNTALQSPSAHHTVSLSRSESDSQTKKPAACEMDSSSEDEGETVAQPLKTPSNIAQRSTHTVVQRDSTRQSLQVAGVSGSSVESAVQRTLISQPSAQTVTISGQLRQHQVAGAVQAILSSSAASGSSVISARLARGVSGSGSLITHGTIDDTVSSTTLEQLREFESVLEQVTSTSQMKERSTAQTRPQPQVPTQSDLTQQILLSQAASTSNTGVEFGSNSSTSTTSFSQEVFSGSAAASQRGNVNFVSQSSVVQTSNIVVTGTAQRVTSATPVVVVTSYSQPVASPALSVTSQSSSSPCVTPAPTPNASVGKTPPKPSKTSKSKTVKSSTSNTSKTSPVPKPQQKPQEDEQTVQRIYAILDEYAEQLRNSPDLNNKPAPRRRSNPPTNPSQSSKRKKSAPTKAKLLGQHSSTVVTELSPGTDDMRTAGSEDSSSGAIQLSQVRSSPSPALQNTDDQLQLARSSDIGSETSQLRGLPPEPGDTQEHQNRHLLAELNTSQPNTSSRTVIVQESMQSSGVGTVEALQSVSIAGSTAVVAGKPVVVGNTATVPLYVPGSVRQVLLPVASGLTTTVQGRPVVVTKGSKVIHLRQVTVSSGSPMLATVPGVKPLQMSPSAGGVQSAALVVRQMCVNKSASAGGTPVSVIGQPTMKQVKLPVVQSVAGGISSQTLTGVTAQPPVVLPTGSHPLAGQLGNVSTGIAQSLAFQESHQVEGTMLTENVIKTATSVQSDETLILNTAHPSTINIMQTGEGNSLQEHLTTPLSNLLPSNAISASTPMVRIPIAHISTSLKPGVTSELITLSTAESMSTNTLISHEEDTAGSTLREEAIKQPHLAITSNSEGQHVLSVVQPSVSVACTFSGEQKHCRKLPISESEQSASSQCLGISVMSDRIPAVGNTDISEQRKENQSWIPVQTKSSGTDKPQSNPKDSRIEVGERTLHLPVQVTNLQLETKKVGSILASKLKAEPTLQVAGRSAVSSLHEALTRKRNLEPESSSAGSLSGVSQTVDSSALQQFQGRNKDSDDVISSSTDTDCIGASSCTLLPKDSREVKFKKLASKSCPLESKTGKNTEDKSACQQGHCEDGKSCESQKNLLQCQIQECETTSRNTSSDVVQGENAGQHVEEEASTSTSLLIKDAGHSKSVKSSELRNFLGLKGLGDHSREQEKDINYRVPLKITAVPSESSETPWRYAPVVKRVNVGQGKPVSVSSSMIRTQIEIDSSGSASSIQLADGSKLDRTGLQCSEDQEVNSSQNVSSNNKKKLSTFSKESAISYQARESIKKRERNRSGVDKSERSSETLEKELRLQKSLSEECEDLGVDEPSTSDLFPEADLLLDLNPSLSFDQTIHGSSPPASETSCGQSIDASEPFSEFRSIDSSSSSLEGSQESTGSSGNGVLSAHHRASPSVDKQNKFPFRKRGDNKKWVSVRNHHGLLEYRKVSERQGEQRKAKSMVLTRQAKLALSSSECPKKSPSFSGLSSNGSKGALQGSNTETSTVSSSSSSDDPVTVTTVALSSEVTIPSPVPVLDVTLDGEFPSDTSLSIQELPMPTAAQKFTNTYGKKAPSGSKDLASVTKKPRMSKTSMHMKEESDSLEGDDMWDSNSNMQDIVSRHDMEVSLFSEPKLSPVSSQQTEDDLVVPKGIHSSLETSFIPPAVAKVTIPGIPLHLQNNNATSALCSTNGVDIFQSTLVSNTIQTYSTSKKSLKKQFQEDKLGSGNSDEHVKESGSSQEVKKPQLMKKCKRKNPAVSEDVVPSKSESDGCSIKSGRKYVSRNKKVQQSASATSPQSSVKNITETRLRSGDKKMSQSFNSGELCSFKNENVEKSVDASLDEEPLSPTSCHPSSENILRASTVTEDMFLESESQLGSQDSVCTVVQGSCQTQASSLRLSRRSSLRGHVKKGCPCCGVSPEPKKSRSGKIEKPSKKTQSGKQSSKGHSVKKR